MCGVVVEIDGPHVLRIRGDEDDPFSRGHICPKATALADLHTDPDRLRTPMRKGRNGFESISWETALDEAAERIHGLQERHGRNSMSVYLGNPNVHNLGSMLFGPVFIRSLRTKNRFSATSVDQLPHMFAAYHMFGHQLLLPVPDIDRTDCFVIFGGNPLASNGSLMSAPGVKKRLDAIRERGGDIIVLDPRRTETASRVATEHHFVRPGTDALVLLSVAREIFRRRAVDLGHVRHLVQGLTALERATEEFSAEATAPHTGVSAETIGHLVDKLLGAKRAIVYGRMGASTQRFGGLCAWLLYAINALTGNLDREGGVMFSKPALDSLAAVAGFGVGRGSFGRWRSRVRELPEFGGELPVSALAEEILVEGEGQIRGLVTLAGNPVVSTPNGAQMDQALDSLELFIAVDPYLNATTRHADLILPPVSPLERSHYDLALHLLAIRNTAKFSDPAFEPAPGALDDWQIQAGIARRLLALRHGRLSSEVLRLRAFEKLGPERILDAGLRIGPYGARQGLLDGLSVAKLRANPHGIDFGAHTRCLEERLPKNRDYIDLAPKPMLEDLDRVRAVLRGDAPTEGELLLIGRRHVRSNNSWLHNSERLMKGKNRCTALLHPDDAAREEIASGDAIEVTSRVGSVTIEAEVTDAMMPGVVSIPHGFDSRREGVELSVAASHPGTNANDLTDEREIDELTGNAVLNGVPIRIAKSSGSKEAAE